MTNREFYTKVGAGEMSEEIMEFALNKIAKMDADAEKNKGKVSKAEQEKRDTNIALATRVAEEVLSTEAKTATDVAAELGTLLGEEIKVQRASYLCRKAVELGLAVQTEVKIPKKGSQKAYTIVG